MSAQENLEKVLRNMHVLLSKSDPMPGNPGKVVVEKQQVLDLLAELNTSIYGIMEEYEMTARSRDKAEREFRKKGDEIIWDASRKAEDVYAASVMYTEEALNNIQDIIKNANESVSQIYTEMNEKLEQEQRQVASNQSELKAQLRNLRDTEKYLRLIEDRNEEILREKRANGKAPKREASPYANRQTEVKVNAEVLEKLGYGEAVEEEVEETPVESVTEKTEEPKAAGEKIAAAEELDADLELYEGKETFSNLEEAMASKKKEPGGFTKMLKSLSGQDKK